MFPPAWVPARGRTGLRHSAGALTLRASLQPRTVARVVQWDTEFPSSEEKPLPFGNSDFILEEGRSTMLRRQAIIKSQPSSSNPGTGQGRREGPLKGQGPEVSVITCIVQDSLSGPCCTRPGWEGLRGHRDPTVQDRKCAAFGEKGDTSELNVPISHYLGVAKWDPLQLNWHSQTAPHPCRA